MADQIIREYSQETVFPGAFKRISWGAVFAGVIVAIMVSLTLGLLGVAIGAATVNPMAEASPMEGLGIGAIIWFCVVTLIAFFAGGWVAGRLAGVARRTDAMLHGVVTWGLTTLFTLVLFGSAIGGLLGGTTTLLSGVAQSPAASQIEEPSGAQDQSEAAKQRMKQMLQQAGRTPEEAEKIVESWSQRMQQGEMSEPAGAETEQLMRETGEAVASGTSKAAWGAFFALIIGALAAAFGGRTGILRDLDKRGERTGATPA